MDENKIILGEEMRIQHFPGHHVKALRQIEKDLHLLDAVCEIIDARIPMSSRNPELYQLTKKKPRLMIMNRVDQADPNLTDAWERYYKKQGMAVLRTDCKSGRGTEAFAGAVRHLLKEKLEELAAKGQGTRQLRVLVSGIPNVGKSTFINKIAKRKAAVASDKPGVTRGKQWIYVDKGLELMDTPGILWPKFESQTVGENLAFTGAVKDDILDRVTLAANLLIRLREQYPDRIEMRYKFTPPADVNGYDLLEMAGRKRGFLISGGEVDLERMAAVLLDEFRGGKLGRITLERPPEEQ